MRPRCTDAPHLLHDNKSLADPPATIALQWLHERAIELIQHLVAGPHTEDQAQVDSPWFLGALCGLGSGCHAGFVNDLACCYFDAVLEHRLDHLMTE